MKKLLNKPLQAFTFYTLFILGLSIPVYYWVVETIWLRELDEHNQITKYHLVQGLRRIYQQNPNAHVNVQEWNKLLPNIQLIPLKTNQLKADSCYTISRGNWHGKQYEIDRFRGLQTYVAIPSQLYKISIETNVEEADEIMYAISFLSLIFFVLLAVGFIQLNRIISVKTWQPFQHTLNQLKKFEVTSTQTVSFIKTTVVEFEELHQVLYKMIQKAQASYQQQKVFIENASHELQTPLALLRSKIDWLYQDKNLTNEQAKVLEALEQPLSRASRINKNLLLLAKIENNQFMQQESISLQNIVGESISLLEDYVANKQLELIDNSTFFPNIFGNKFLVEMLFNNLLINAIRHTQPNGLIVIECQEKEFQIKNTGVIPLQKQQLFKRFAIASNEHSNSGLGLAIVHEICLRYAWHITYSHEEGFHIFRITF